MKSAILSLHLSMRCARIIILKKFTLLLMEMEERDVFFSNIFFTNFTFLVTTYYPLKNILNKIGIRIMRFLKKILEKFQNLSDLCLTVYCGQTTQQLTTFRKLHKLRNHFLLRFPPEGKKSLRLFRTTLLFHLMLLREDFRQFQKELFSTMLFILSNEEL